MLFKKTNNNSILAPKISKQIKIIIIITNININNNKTNTRDKKIYLLLFCHDPFFDIQLKIEFFVLYNYYVIKNKQKINT